MKIKRYMMKDKKSGELVFHFCSKTKHRTLITKHRGKTYEEVMDAILLGLLPIY
jgi:hypothetical protein